MVSGKDRQKQLAREHYERQQTTRVQRERAAKRTAAIGTTVGVLVVVGGIVAAATLLGGGDDEVTAATPTDTAVPSASAPAAGPKAYDPASGTCEYQPDGQAAKDVGQPPAKVAAQPATMTIKTSLGVIEASLDGAKAPCTVGSFQFLAEKKYFNDTKCHRLTTEGIKVLQCGDPTASGSGGPGYRFTDENLEGASYKRGVLAMANSGPGTNGSQFFIVYGDETDSLPDSYTPFGTITKGIELVDQVAKDGVEGGGGDGPPKTAVDIKDVTITGKS
ncbi:peptidyl-prolyl cis-trans isomerase [Acrocarpospora corrugata]|uniref:Peptidyl-prolyl cis-trans isomerase n=1 Tax=Acrocarpospora corrugata TaxID=35763 RepID=A0A5M3W5C0_9ACTN|nr:peptidyl-prolyl cis-trans isomerase [Acrocarpospora corrugata]